ncbi:formate dehydrogenase iron-sulfur subunit [Methylacidimicrobium cyclopophantes]|uniref:Formate dehydrogenase iron-sulfur subunit n=1 Tax=Methylacidimicrobium cyclopophantes TaxID=1041766 RepID=A0A5E6MM09_9BACT|nr:NADH-quinone oxidoreductase subunit NuoF [Methylacidimicrobium cyclopophantes]VVM06454.1 formate dehydrogenase iron-sulfur subunit [Methylacidimicrobium cyclopophantes]
MKVYVPRDFSACALGADEVARAIGREAERRGISLELVRNGSRGLYWLEPLVEVERNGKRIAYGPVGEEEVAGLFDGGFLEGKEHPARQGDPEEIPYLRRQKRLVFRRVGKNDPLSLDQYRRDGGFAGLTRALTLSPQQIVEEVTKSGLRGRGGAGFPTGIKWKTTLQADADQKYIVCNADEGDSGTFSDRMVIEGDPFLLIEGMAIAGLAVGATEGYVYLRSEYPLARKIFEEALERARAGGYLGKDILGSGKAFSLNLYIGAGAYVCGEETSLLESLEGKRGMIRPRPPLPAIHGLWQKPTVVNNVITLASVPSILADGAEAYARLGVGRSKGTLPVQLSGNLKRPGLVEVPFGITLEELLFEYGGGTASGRPLKAIQIGGPLGPYLPPSLFSVTLDYEELAKVRGIVGHGGIVAFDDTVNLGEMARYAMEFCAGESCGKCTPCRIGSTRGVEVMDRILSGKRDAGTLQLLVDLCDVMIHASLCGLGGMTPFPVLSGLRFFPEDFGYTKADVGPLVEKL